MTVMTAPNRALGLRPRLMAAFLGIGALAVAACGIAWIGFARLEAEIGSLARVDQPRVIAAQELALAATALAAAAPQLASAASEAERSAGSADLASRVAALRRDALTLGADGAALVPVIDALGTRISALADTVRDRLSAEAERARMVQAVTTDSLAAVTSLSGRITRATEQMGETGRTLIGDGEMAIDELTLDIDDVLLVLVQLRMATNQLVAGLDAGFLADVSAIEQGVASARSALRRVSTAMGADAATLARPVEALLRLAAEPMPDTSALPAIVAVLGPALDQATDVARERITRAGRDLTEKMRTTTEQMVDTDVALLRRLLELSGTTQTLGGQLASLAGATPDTLASQREQAIVLTQRAQALLNGLSPEDAVPEVAQPLARLIGSPATIAGLRETDLAARARGAELLAATRAATEDATAKVRAVVATAAQDAQTAASHAEAAGSAARTQLAVLAAVIAVIAVLVLWLVVGRGIVSPLVGIEAAMRRLADGDLDTPLPPATGAAEIRAMATTLDHFRHGLAENRRLEAEQALIELRSEEQRREVLASLAGQFERSVHTVVAKLTDVSTRMAEDARGMSTSAEVTTTQANVVTSAAEVTTISVQTVAAAAEELSASIGEIGRQAEDSAAVARSAIDQAASADAVIVSLQQAAQRIGDVVRMIADIAEQTNLLALNATIEAARAGEAGRGFAVVANEVKALASQTGQATEDIAQQIGAMQTATSQAVEAIRAVGATIQSMGGIATTIAGAVEEQRAATQEIARTVQEAARGTADVLGTIGSVRDAASETRVAADRVVDTTAHLVEQSGELKRDAAEFLSQIRVA